MTFSMIGPDQSGFERYLVPAKYNVRCLARVRLNRYTLLQSARSNSRYSSPDHEPCVINDGHDSRHCAEAVNGIV